MEKIKVKLPKLTVTDVLRIAVHMSGGNISLPKVPPAEVRMNRWSSYRSANPEREKFKFKKFTRKERKYILSLLEQTNCDARESALKDKRWIRLGEILHPGEYAKQFPKAFEMFDDIRNTKVKTWYGEVEEAFKKDFNMGLSKLSERPGEFMRRLDMLMRKAGSDSKKVAAVSGILKEIGTDVSNKVLYESYGHFEKRTSPVTNRTIMVKGSRRRTTLPYLPALSSYMVKNIRDSIMRSLSEKVSKLEKLGNVYIHEDLKKIPLPTNMRSMNPSLKPVMRGQRVPIGNQDAKVIRAFVHWFDEYGNQDIDLTATFMGMGKIKHVGWNGDHNSDIGCYSGDVRHRQGACAEYIDVNVGAALKAGFKYVVLDARNYNGGPFTDLKECVFGYMEREHPKAGDAHWAPSIQNAIQLQSQSSTTLVAAIDLETQEYIFLDIDANGIPVASANFEAIMTALKPYTEEPSFSVYDLLKIHADARGKHVKTEKNADLVLNMESFPSYLEIGQWMGI